jgi:hypothetical protein
VVVAPMVTPILLLVPPQSEPSTYSAVARSAQY